MTKKRIGWIGLGHIGTPMSLNLLKAGFETGVYNRSKDKMKPLAEKGAKTFKTIEELCNSSDIIFTMVSDDEAVKSIYKKLLKENVSGKLFINMSTVSPDTSREVAKQCVSKSAHFLEAPVSGSVKPATEGTLVILAAGNRKDYEYAIPFFEKLGKLSLYLGETGKGAIAKLAINYYLAITIQGIAETSLFAQENGLSKETMMLIINESACGSPISSMKTSSVINSNYPPAFPLKHMAKDVRLACGQGLASPMANPVLATFQQALEEGLGEEDVMAVIKTLQK